LTGLMRGTAGTAAADHNVGTSVYDMGRGSLLPIEYQDRVIKDTNLGDGSTVLFEAPNIQLNIPTPDDSSTDYIDNLVEVYVGGTRQYAFGNTEAESQYRYTVSNVSPLIIEFVTDDNQFNQLTAPPPGVEVTIAQRRGLGWYGPGVKPTNGTALQDTNTIAARFLRGL